MFFILILISLNSKVFAESVFVSIDNPSFRKIISAVPEFSSENETPEVKNLARDSSQELSRLLNFSGLFNVVPDSSFLDLTKKLRPGDYSASDMAGVSVPLWRNLSVESLTLAQVSKQQNDFTLTIRTIDIIQAKPVIGKKYSKVKANEMVQVIRKYADQVLKYYTGKSGIFASKLVFVGRKKDGDNKQIFISDFDGANAKQVTSGKAIHLSPAWSRDGKFITYTSFEDGNPDLFLMNVNSGIKRKLSGKKGMNSGGNWAPGDKIIAFTGAENGDTDIYTIPPSGGQRKPFIRGEGLDVDPNFSPDGKYLAYVSGRFKNPHIFAAKIEWTGSTPKVSSEQRVTFAGWYNASPAWTPESDRMAFAGYDKEIDRWDLFMVNPDGKKLERLTLKMGDNEHPSFSPNGQNIIFESSRTDGKDVKTNKQLYIMNRDGSSQRQLITGIHEVEQPNWGPQNGD